MKAAEKQQLYDFLITAESWVQGYPTSEHLIFSDDISSNVTKNNLSFESKTGVKSLTLETVAAKIAACSRCQLAKNRHNVVPGVGVSSPAVLVVGEGPGADEDAQGEPFVGKAGQLLDKMLASISLSRHANCFIANIVKCRPPNNRDPLPEESEACSSFLQAQIHILKPAIILAVGRIAAQNLLKTSEGINKIRGSFRDYNGIPFMATYHPSALLRDESLKRPAWEDLKLFRSKLLELVPDYDAPFAAQQTGQQTGQQTTQHTVQQVGQQ